MIRKATDMITHRHQVSVQEFAKSYLPILIEELRDDFDFRSNDAKILAERMIQRLNKRFKVNKMRPPQVFKKAMTNIVIQEINKFRRLMDKNFGFTPTTFDGMVSELKAGNELIFEQIFISHFEDCMNYMKRKYKASHQDAYDSTMKTMIRFCQLLKEDKIKYGNLRFLYTQMAGQHYLKWIKRQRKIIPIEGIDLIEELPQFDKDTIAVLRLAFGKLGDACTELLGKFYHQEKTLKEIAEQFDKPAATIRKQKQRCMEKLRGFYAQLC